MSDGYKRGALAVLTAIYTVSFMDRIMLGILMQHMKVDLRLSDAQLGFLTGIAFGLFYATLGIPIARWADRGNRVTIASLAMATWSAMVLICGFVTNFFQLALARMGAGIGEAGVFPPGYSLIGDYFDTRQRVRALSVFMMGVPISLAISYVFAGWMDEHFGWRLAFIAIAVPGMIGTMAARLVLREPREAGRARLVAPGKVQGNTRGALLDLWRSKTYRYLVLALTMSNFVSVGVGQWFAVFFIRQHHVPTTELGIWLGVMAGGCAAIATRLGGYVADRFFPDSPSGQLGLFAIIVGMQLPCVLLLVYLPSKLGALLMLLPIYMCLFSFYGPVLALTQRLVADERRALAAAVMMFIVNLIALGIAPEMVGILSDLLTPTWGVGGLQIAMSVTASAALAGAFFFTRAARHVEGELGRPVQASIAPEGVVEC